MSNLEFPPDEQGLTREEKIRIEALKILAEAGIGVGYFARHLDGVVGLIKDGR